ncbi:TetR/AcrR family transcriptional regulator [Nocardia halotolerans]|uniref:TetR/AcrR family transcriptional regulator n=1 Tax=Nocardia halotolerans TaxID=1755878 RepID=A0ABV8VLG5_9NOCA
MVEPETPGPAGGGGLGDERLVEAALAVLDDGGASALSIRAVAERLGVAPDAVREHFAGSGELERAVIEHVLSTVPLRALTDYGVEWTAAVIQFALGLRARLLRHPAVVTLMMSGPLDGPAADGPAARDMSESLFVCLARGGLATQWRAHGVYAVIVHVLGSVALDVAETDGKPPFPPDSERVAARRKALEDTDLSRWPRTEAHLDEIAAWTSVDQFVWALRVLLVGMTAS